MVLYLGFVLNKTSHEDPNMKRVNELRVAKGQKLFHRFKSSAEMKILFVLDHDGNLPEAATSKVHSNFHWAFFHIRLLFSEARCFSIYRSPCDDLSPAAVA
jgi:hypothetical protein